MCIAARTVRAISFSGVSAIRKAFWQGIREAGFLPTAPVGSVPERAAFPLRWPANDRGASSGTRASCSTFMRVVVLEGLPGSSAFLALLFVFALLRGNAQIPEGSALRAESGSRYREIRAVVGLVAFISGLCWSFFSIMVACGGLQSACRNRAIFSALIP